MEPTKNEKLLQAACAKLVETYPNAPVLKTLRFVEFLDDSGVCQTTLTMLHDFSAHPTEIERNTEKDYYRLDNLVKVRTIDSLFIMRECIDINLRAMGIDIDSSNLKHGE